MGAARGSDAASGVSIDLTDDSTDGAIGLVSRIIVSAVTGAIASVGLGDVCAGDARMVSGVLHSSRRIDVPPVPLESPELLDALDDPGPLELARRAQ